jgi:SAM-dependent methyltransferase
MTDEPLVWHYGLMAERWAEFNTAAREVPFFQQEIARFGQPVLDLACGVGRLLLPLRRLGIDIDGCDISADMLKQCRKKADSEGLEVTLYRQPMHAFALPRRYKTIYICDSFGLAGSAANDLETLRRCHQHLEPGGALLLNIEAEYNSPEAWEGWLPARRQALPEPWPAEGQRLVAADGSEYVHLFRYLDIDPLEQTYTRQVRLEKWQSGALVGSEEYTLRGRMYFKNELLLMLNIAGFRQVSVRGGAANGAYSDAPATADDDELIFTAIK